MGKVVTMSGHDLKTANTLLEEAAERDDLLHVVVVMTRRDGMSEVWYSRQQINELTHSAAVLNHVANQLAGGTIAED